MEIKGRKVVLRPAVLEERRMIYEWMARSDVTSSMMGPPTFPDESIPTWEEFLDDYESYYFDGSSPRQGRSFVITVDGEPVGQINYDMVNRERRLAELDIWMSAERHTGKGFGVDALEALTDFLHRELEVDECVIRPSARNPRAVHAYEKAGFRRLEISPEQAKNDFGPGDYRDEVVLIKTF